MQQAKPWKKKFTFPHKLVSIRIFLSQQWIFTRQSVIWFKMEFYANRRVQRKQWCEKQIKWKLWKKWYWGEPSTHIILNIQILVLVLVVRMEYVWDTPPPPPPNPLSYDHQEIISKFHPLFHWCCIRWIIVVLVKNQLSLVEIRQLYLSFLHGYISDVCVSEGSRGKMSAAIRDRTRDLKIFSLTLSQLSYYSCAHWANIHKYKC